MSLPTASEINPIADDLDGRAAQDHFLGKTIEDATKLFQENSLYYLEDLLWMGPKAFCHYFPAAARYLKSDAGQGDTDAVRSLASIIHSRMHDDGVLISEVYPVIRDLADFLIQNRKRFDASLGFDRVEVQAYRDILRALNGEQDAAPNSRPPFPLSPSPEVQTSDPLRTPSSGGCG